MNGDIMSNDEALMMRSADAINSGMITYIPIMLSFNSVVPDVASAGQLKEKTFVKFDYKLSQSFPDDFDVPPLKSTQTEIAQVHAVGRKSEYYRYPSAIEIITSTLNDVETSQLDSEILNESMKSYDRLAYRGDGVNFGFLHNPNGNYEFERFIFGADDNFNHLMVIVSEMLTNLRDATDITEQQYSSVIFYYTSKVAYVLSQVSDKNISNREKFEKMFPSFQFMELPKYVEPRDVVALAYSSVITLERGALPSVAGRKVGDYAMSNGTLYAYESTNLDIKKKGALQLVELTGN